MTMTCDEWRQKRETEKQVDDYLEKARQSEFAREQSRESVFTRPMESIVDADN